MSFLTLLWLTILLSFALLIGAISTLYQIMKGKISRGYWALVLGIAAILPYVVTSDIIPKVQDVSNFESGNYECTSGVCSSISRGKISSEIKIENQFYEYNTSDFELQCKSKYKIYYLPHSHYIVKWEELN